MPYYILAIILSVLGAFFGILSSIFQGVPRKVLILCCIAAFLSAGYDVMTTPVPKPEIYTTNGNHAEDNELYFKTEWPLTVKYTFVQNADPMYNGETFRKNIPIHESVTVSATEVTLSQMSPASCFLQSTRVCLENATETNDSFMAVLWFTGIQTAALRQWLSSY